MDFAPLTPADCNAWAELLAISFGRTAIEMGSLLDWLHLGWPLVAWGAWDDKRLAAQYSCRIVDLQIPDCDTPVKVGMSINMAVHPDYRGQGLIKHVARPVYETIAAQGGIAGVGFSNAEGVKVDLKSKSYGYRVVGKMTSTLVWLSAPKNEPLTLTEHWPEKLNLTPQMAVKAIQFAPNLKLIRHRFVQHPFRQYAFGVWQEQDKTHGLVIYRPIQLGLIKGAGLLGAYGKDTGELLQRWAAALKSQGIRFVQAMNSLGSSLRQPLRQIGHAVDLPYTRTPYFLTAKPLDENWSQPLFSFNNWDCSGGDIL